MKTMQFEDNLDEAALVVVFVVFDVVTFLK